MQRTYRSGIFKEPMSLLVLSELSELFPPRIVTVDECLFAVEDWGIVRVAEIPVSHVQTSQPAHDHIR